MTERVPSSPFPVPMNTRRQFLITAPVATLGFIEACKRDAQSVQQQQSGTPSTPGAAPAFGTSPDIGPEVTTSTFAEAEKLMQVTMTPAQCEMAAASWRRSLAPLMESRVGPR